MLHHWFIPATWSRFFGRRARPDNAPPSSARAAPSSASAGPKSQPRPAPIPGSQDYWLALAACRLPPAIGREVEDGLRLAVRYRAYWSLTGKAWPDESPIELPGDAPERQRFGTHGEQLVPQPTPVLAKLLVAELKQAVHTLEAFWLSRTERQWCMLMHGARLGQLYDELALCERQRAPIQTVRQALEALLL